MPGLYHTSWPDAQGQLTWKSTEFWQFFLGPALSIPFLALPWLVGDGRIRLLLTQVLLSGLGLWVVVFYHAHYAAPIAATVYLLMMLGMRRMCSWRFGGRAFGIGLTRLLVLVTLLTGPAYFIHYVIPSSNSLVEWLHLHYVLVLGISVGALVILRLASMFAAAQSLTISSCEMLLLAAIVLQVCFIQKNLYPDNYPFVDDLNEPFRKPVEQTLAAMPGQHLVLVRYSKDHNSGEEYVYNEADIDRAKTVWAREIPGKDLTPLLAYFRNRDVWVFEPDEDDSSVSPYSSPRAAP